VCLCTSDIFIILSMCDYTLLIMVDSGRWLYLVVTFIGVMVIVAVAFLRAKAGLIQSPPY
jgi:hypothetical protein